jgi:hypothetical protein
VKVFTEHMKTLEEWLLEQNTEPSISQVILVELHQWFRPRMEQIALPIQVELLYCLQEEIGWGLFLEGFQHMEWRNAQQQYFQDIQSLKLADKRSAALIKELWKITWTMWTDRNEATHKTCNLISENEIRALDQEI